MTLRSVLLLSVFFVTTTHANTYAPAEHGHNQVIAQEIFQALAPYLEGCSAYSIYSNEAGRYDIIIRKGNLYLECEYDPENHVLNLQEEGHIFEFII